MRYYNVSNAAAFGIEVRDPDGLVQLVNGRGSQRLVLGILPAGKSRWMRTTIDQPERFGFTGPVKTVGELAKITEVFMRGGPVI